MNVALTASIVMELLKFAREMREIYGDEVTDAQIAEAWTRSAVRFQAAADAWKNAPPPAG